MQMIRTSGAMAIGAVRNAVNSKVFVRTGPW